MKNEHHCKEILNLQKIIKKGSIIHVTNRGNVFRFIEFKNKKLFFSIPNHNDSVSPYIKSISEEQFCKLLKKIIQKKILTKDDFPFQDCRKSAFYGFLYHLFASKLK